MTTRTCTRAACQHEPVATLTYVYIDRAVVMGPLAQDAQPYSYDFCSTHADRLTVPRGWEMVKILPPAGSFPSVTAPRVPTRRVEKDDLSVLLDAVRDESPQYRVPHEPTSVTEVARRGHLRVLQHSR
ncbi:MAG: DUF3499 domain-containing protein [Cellulomonadaceae bacterium]|nr:DUF3499 domain-containing protein [Cellulomonadaceae bacterium]